MKKSFRKLVSLFMAVLMFAAVIPFSGLHIEANAQTQIDNGKSEVEIIETKAANTKTESSVNSIINPFADFISMIKDLVEIIRAAIAFINADMPGLPFSFNK